MINWQAIKFVVIALCTLGVSVIVKAYRDSLIEQGKTAEQAKTRLEKLKVAEDTLIEHLEIKERDIAIEEGNRHLNTAERSERLFIKLQQQQHENGNNS